jgi:hypothetical protein
MDYTLQRASTDPMQFTVYIICNTERGNRLRVNIAVMTIELHGLHHTSLQMPIDIATIVKLSLSLEYVTCLYVTSDNNFKFIAVIGLCDTDMKCMWAVVTLALFGSIGSKIGESLLIIKDFIFRFISFFFKYLDIFRYNG